MEYKNIALSYVSTAFPKFYTCALWTTAAFDRAQNFMYEIGNIDESEADAD